MADTQNLDGFRTELRTWLEANCPAEMRGGGVTEDAICWGGKDSGSSVVPPKGTRCRLGPLNTVARG